MEKPPSHDGLGLVNLMAELERRMTGTASSPGLADPEPISEGPTYVLVLFDGLGVAQLQHEAAGVFRSTRAATLESPFPSMTNVALATVATGLSPSQHGQIAHLTWYPDLGTIVNSLKWVTMGGDPVDYEYDRLLPGPNLWERLKEKGIEPITVQPGDFQTSPMTRSVYRGARFEGVWSDTDLIDATVALAAEPGRFIFTYVPFVDVAGHIHGQGSDEFRRAMSAASSIWEGIVSGVDDRTVVVATADHGLMEVSETDKLIVRDPAFKDLRFAGDPRGVHLWGEDGLIEDLASLTGGELIDPVPLIGPEPSDTALSRLGQRVLMAPPGKVVLPRGFDKRLRCYHGGLSREEVEVPLLVG